MPVLEDTELFRELKLAKLSPLYLLYGAETCFIYSALHQIEALAVKSGFESFNLQRFDAAKADWNEIEEACEALPMMAEQKCVSVRDADADKLPKGDLDRLMGLVSAPGETTVLVLYMTSVSVDAKKAKWKKLLEAAAKTGVVCEFRLKDKLTLKRALCERARRSHVSMDMAAAGALVDRCSQSYSILQNELDKLVAYVSGGENPSYTITEREIDACCIRSIDSTAFDLARSILAGGFDRAYQLLDELFYQRQEAVAILGALSMAFSDLYRAKCAQLAKKTPEQVAADFKYPKNRMFAVKNAFRDVRSFSAEQIRACMEALYQADRTIKSSRAEDRLVLEQMIGRMQLAARQNRPAGRS